MKNTKHPLPTTLVVGIALFVAAIVSCVNAGLVAELYLGGDVPIWMSVECVVFTVVGIPFVAFGKRKMLEEMGYSMMLPPMPWPIGMVLFFGTVAVYNFLGRFLFDENQPIWFKVVCAVAGLAGFVLIILGVRKARRIRKDEDKDA